jgi:Spy/CpxP family protein refolding chaperone
MHPGFFGWWKHHHAHGHAHRHGFGPDGRAGHHDHAGHAGPPHPGHRGGPFPDGRGEETGDAGPYRQPFCGPGGFGRGPSEEGRARFRAFFGGHGPGHGHGPGFGGDDFGAGLGVRRPLRFLAHKLELEEAQAEKLGTILERLKIERAQAEVDQRRRAGSLADAFEGESLDESLLTSAAEVQRNSAERLREAVTQALADIHKLLDEEQRRKFAYMLRTGVVTL